jgi:hypothetical protein
MQPLQSDPIALSNRSRAASQGDFSMEPIHGSGQQLVVPVIDSVPDTQEQRLDSFGDGPNFDCMEIAEMWQSQHFVDLAQQTWDQNRCFSAR